MAFLYRLLPPRPSFAQDMSSADADVMQRHVGYWQELLNREVAVAFGPVLDAKGPWGLGLLDLDDEQAAREIGEGDPAVQTGPAATNSYRWSSFGSEACGQSIAASWRTCSRNARTVAELLIQPAG